jgi:hypothetical protein
MALAVDAVVAAHDAHREHPVRAHEPSSSRPIAPALTVVGRQRSHARRERSRNPRPRGRHGQRVATHVHADENGLAVARVVPRPGAFHRTSLCYRTRDGAFAGRAPHAASVPMRTADRRAYRVSMTAVVQVDRTDDSTA